MGIVGVLVERIRADHDIAAIPEHKVVLACTPESVSHDGNTAGVDDFHIRDHIAEHVFRNCKRPPPTSFGVRPNEADVGAAGSLESVLNRATRDGNLRMTVEALRAVDENIRRGFALGTHVHFDVAPRNLKVAQISFAHHDTATLVVTDVAANNVDLMEIHIVKINPNAPIMVNVTVADDHIPVASV